MPSKKHRTGRIEAVRYAGEVSKRRSAGESLAWIYSDLAERGDVAVSYSAFTRWVKKLELGMLQRMGQPQHSSDFIEPRPSNAGRAGGEAIRDSGPTESQDQVSGGSHQPARQHPKHARLGVPILPAPNSDPDCDALFGREE